MENEKSNKLIVPAAIVLAGLIIAGAVYYDRKSAANPSENQPAQTAESTASLLDNLKPVTAKDHILGDPNAPVTLVLFSDLECFYCKRFHATMKQIVEEYGKTGKLKYVFRHLPLDIHPKSKNEAAAAECAADLGGNDAFWKYVDRVFEITPSNNGLDPLELPKIAEYVGLNKTKFNACLASGKFDQIIAENAKDGMDSGALGTPYSVILGPNGQKSAIPGALPYSDVKAAIDEMLK
jgi:protein-disulfide isomerase